MFYFLIAILLSLFSTLIFTPLVCDLIIILAGELAWPFSRVLDRVLLFFLIFFLYIFRKKIKLGLAFKVFKNEISVNSRFALFIKYALAVSLTAGLTMAVIPLIVLDSDLIYEPRTISYFYSRIPKVLIASLIIAIIEESFFRVICQRALIEKYKLLVGILITNLIYAFVHFIKPYKQFQYDGSFLSGFNYAYSLMSNSFDLNFLYAFLALFFVGLILSLTINKTKSLILVMGLHAGWIIGIKMARYITNLPEGMTYPMSTGREFYLLTFWQAWVSIFLVFVLLWIFGNKGAVGK